MNITTGIISHIEIYVSNLELSKYFWKNLLEQLGYEKFQEWDEGISWKLNETYIVFVQTEEKYLTKPYHRKQSGLNHLAFYVKNREELDKIASNLVENGITILYNDRFRKTKTDDPYSIFFEDPDRIKVELVYS